MDFPAGVNGRYDGSIIDARRGRRADRSARRRAAIAAPRARTWRCDASPRRVRGEPREQCSRRTRARRAQDRSCRGLLHPLVHDADHERLHHLRGELADRSRRASCPQRDRLARSASITWRPQSSSAARWRCATGARSAVNSHLWKMTSNTACVRASLARRVRPSTAIAAQRAERIAAAAATGRVEHRLHRHRRPLAHRLEQLGLVAEMPVDRAAGDASGGGHFRERRVRHALRAEHALGRTEQRFARRRRFLPRPAHHQRLPPVDSRSRSNVPTAKQGCKHSRMYVILAIFVKPRSTKRRSRSPSCPSPS